MPSQVKRHFNSRWSEQIAAEDMPYTVGQFPGSFMVVNVLKVLGIRFGSMSSLVYNKIPLDARRIMKHLNREVG
jgi:hypothetical protein